MDFSGYLCICAIVKNETSFLEQWVAHHLLQGADRVLVYDNDSTVPVRETLQKYIDCGRVMVEEISGEERQIPAYASALGRYGRNFTWMGFIDADEFLLPMPDEHGRDEDLPAILTRYEEHAGLAVNWVMFGSSGHESRPEGGQMENYIHRFPLDAGVNSTVKTIVRPALTLRPESPHHFKYAKGHTAVNEAFLPVNAPYSPVAADTLRINHYFFRSREDFEQKIERGRGDMSVSRFRHRREAFDAMLDMALEEDRDILRFLPAVREVMNSGDPEAALARLRPPLPGDLDRCREKIMVLLNDKDTAGAHGIAVRMTSDLGSAESWLTRSFTARMLPDDTALDEAHFCITRALSIEDSFEAHHQLMMLHLQSGEKHDARTAARYIKWRLDKGTFKVQGDLADKVLEEIEDILSED